MSFRPRDLWRPIDAIADWMIEELDTRWQMRGGVLLFLSSFYFWAKMFSTDEPFLIYFMSALTLTVGGVTVVLQCQTLEVMEKGSDTEEG